MICKLSMILIAGALIPSSAMSQTSDQSWVATSNAYTKLLMDIEMKHHPESGSSEGLAEYDNKVSQPTFEDEDRQRHEEEAVVTKLKAALLREKNPEVVQDLHILLRSTDLDFRIQDYRRAHAVPFLNASGYVFGGLHTLLDEQTPAARRPAAVVRIREYAGLDPDTQNLQRSSSVECSSRWPSRARCIRRVTKSKPNSAETPTTWKVSRRSSRNTSSAGGKNHSPV